MNEGMTAELRSILIGTAGLSACGLIALLLTLARATPSANSPEASQVKKIAAAGIMLHSVHFIEEWQTGFHVRFPTLLGLAPWTSAFFLSHNLFFIGVWILSLAVLRAQTHLALFPLWFLAIASTANGIAHPLFSGVVADYFPGLLTSPLVGICGVLLMRALFMFTRLNMSPPFQG